MKKNTFSWQQGVFTILAVILISAFVGIIASVFTQQSLDGYLADLRTEELMLSLSQVKPSPVPGTYEEALRAVENSRDSLVYIFDNAQKTSTASEFLYLQDALGLGVVVTSDGWLLCEANAFSGYAPERVTYVIGTQIFEAQTVVYDTRESAVLVKVEASGLPAISFGSSTQTRAGEYVFGLEETGALMVNALAREGGLTSTAPQSAERFTHAWQLRNAMQAGSILLDASGALIGFVKNNIDAVALYRLEPFIDSVLAVGKPEYAGLGAYGKDLGSAINADTQTIGTDHGFLVTRVVAFGPAGTVLQVQDVVTAINGAQLTSDFTLARALSRYKVGDEITLTFVRGGEERTASLVLENNDLLY